MSWSLANFLLDLQSLSVKMNRVTNNKRKAPRPNLQRRVRARKDEPEPDSDNVFSDEDGVEESNDNEETEEGSEEEEDGEDDVCTNYDS